MALATFEPAAAKCPAQEDGLEVAAGSLAEASSATKFGRAVGEL